jgi:hypothetical protein
MPDIWNYLVKSFFTPGNQINGIINNCEPGAC